LGALAGRRRSTKAAARFAAGLITFRKRLANGSFDQSANNDLTSFSYLFEEDWYRQFYSLFFQPIGGLASLLDNYEIRAFDGEMDERRAELNSSLDMVEFFLTAILYSPDHTSRRQAEKFVAYNGFARPVGFYGIPKGPRRESRAAPIALPTVSKHWDAIPETLCLAYVLRREWPDLWNLKLGDQDLLNKLIEMANNHERIASVFAHYHWLLDHCVQHLKITKKKFELFPALETFADRRPCTPLFTPDEFRKSVDEATKTETADQSKK
jgi:hypothetical protein